MNNPVDLLIANAELAAGLLQHMADNEIDSDYFAVVTDSPNCGREVQSEHSVTEAALMAAGIIEQLIAQLEAAQKEITDWRSVAEAAAQDDGDWRKLADSKNEVISRLASGIINLESLLAAAQRDRNLHYSVSEKFRIELIANEAALSAANEKLKGEQVPVAWTDAEELRGMAKDGCGYLFKVDPVNPFTDPCRQIMLFTAPQKLVVRQQHADWSNATFGNVGPVGPLKHLSKEALETAASPGDLSEWADMQFLFWDAQRRAGITDAQIEQAMIDKLEINKSRVWPEPKDGEPREHIKAGFPVEG